MKSSRRLLYVSCAPRVSLRSTAENLAARNHINSVISAFESHAFKCKKFILGDILPPSFSDSKSQEVLTKSNASRIISDFIRIGFRIICQPVILLLYARKTDFVYERFGSFQAGGYLLKLVGKTWILESNAILYEESFRESRSIYLWRIARYFEKRAYRSCDVLVCVSEALKAGIITEFGVNPNKIFVLKNAVDTEFFSPRKRREADTKKVVIGYVGSLVKWQSLDLLIQALSKVSHDARSQLQIVIVGDGPERKRLESIAKNLGLSDKIEFQGRVTFEMVPEVIDDFDVGYCFARHNSTSTGESFNSPMKLYEYLAMGKPIISPLNEDLASMDNYDEFTFVILDKNDIAKQLEVLVEKRNELSRMGKAARNAIMQGHSWRHRVKELIINLKQEKNDF